MTWQLALSSAVIACLMLAVVFGVWYDVLAVQTGSLSLSRRLYDAACLWPIIPFVLGMIVGGLGCHFFWSIHRIP